LRITPLNDASNNFDRKEIIMKKSFVVGMLAVSVLTLAGCATLTGSSNQTQSGGINVAQATKVTVTKGTMDSTVVANGKVIPRQYSIVSFPTAGRIYTLTVQLGDSVKAGQLLAQQITNTLQLVEKQQYANYLSALATYSQTIKPSNQRDIDQAQAALNSAYASYNEIKKGPTASAIESALHSWNSSKNSLWSAQVSRDASCGSNGVGSPQCKTSEANVGSSYENERRAYQAYVDAQQPPTPDKLAAAWSSVVAAQTRLDALLHPDTGDSASASAKVQQALASWQQAQEDIKNASVFAPLDGVITTLNFGVGDQVNANQTVMQVTANERPLFEVDVDEADIAQIRLGQEARVLLQSYNNIPITASVEYIAPATTASGNVNTIKVRLGLGSIQRPQFQTGQGQGQGNAQRGGAQQGTPAAGGQGQGGNQAGAGRPISQTFALPRILIGQTGTSQIILSQITDALQVPNRVLVADRQTRGFTVWRLTADGKAESVPVTVGFRGATNTQIMSGLNEGDTVLIPPATSTSTQNNANQGFGGGAGPAVVVKP
jgi:HlyD family secretion protein